MQNDVDTDLDDYYSSLIDEYSDIATDCDEKGITIESALVSDHEWTKEAAEDLVALAENYGSFMLINAAALATAMGIEDGNLGF